MSTSNTGDIFEIKLQVRYNGLKATQYFAKFTLESDKVFRDDLLALKLPHPKRDNTTFISHGCIECAWPTVTKNGILHKQLATRIQAPQELLQELSISNITIKYIYPPKANKRPNPYAGSQPSNHQFEKPLASSSGSWGAPSSTNYAPPSPWDAPRPYKVAKLDHGDESSSTSSSTALAFPTFTNLPPLPPRKAPERIHVPTPSSSKGTRLVASQPSTDRVEAGVKQAALSSPSVFSFKGPPEAFNVGQSFEVAPGIFSFNKPSTTPGVGQSVSAASSIFGFNKPPAGPGVGHSSSPAPGIFSFNKPPAGLGVGQSASPIISFKSPPTGSKALTAKSPTPPQTQPFRLTSKPTYRDVPTGPRATDNSYTKPVASASTPSIKQEYSEVSLHDEAPQQQSTCAAETPFTPVEATSKKPSRFQPAARPVDQQDNLADKEKGADLVQEFLSSLQLKPNAGPQSPESSMTQQKGQSSLKVETREAQLPPLQPQPHSQSTPVDPAQEERPQRSDWYDGSEMPPFRSPEADTRGTTTPSSLPTAVLLNTLLASTSSLPSIPQVTSHNPPVDQGSKAQASSVHPSASSVPSGPSSLTLASQLQAVPLSSSAAEKSADEHPNNMKRKRGIPPRNENLLAIQGLLREASDIKREINAKVAREAVVIAQLKALDSLWLPRPIKIGSDPSEDMKDELARLQYELEGERKLREEAENAIRDVRRECKEPFIVPSLLDAFVEVSKLTTRSLRPSQIVATPTEADMSMSPMG